MAQSIPTDSSEQAAANQRNLRRLVLSVQASLHKLNLLIAICDNPVYRDELIHTYEAELTAKGIACYQIQLDRQQPSLKQSLLDWQANIPDEQRKTPTLITVRGGDELLGVRLEQPKSAQERFFFSVQWTREGLREFQFPVVLWVTQSVAQGLAQQAPDFWSWRGGVFEFDQPMAWQVSSQPQAAERPESSPQPEALADPAELEQQIAALQAEDPESPLLESLYQSLGETYYKRLEWGISSDRHQETEKAIAAFQSAIVRRESLADPTPLATSLNDLAYFYYSMERYSEAEPLLVRSLQIYETQLGQEHPTTATSLNNLASLYKSMGRYSEAEPLHVRSLQIREARLGQEHPDTATSLNNLALLYESMGRYSEAEPLYVRSLQIREARLGQEHPDTATSLNNLASLYESMGRYSEAEPLYLRALKIKQKVLPTNHPSLKSSWDNLRYLIQQAVESDRTQELSSHPITQSLLQEIQAQDE